MRMCLSFLCSTTQYCSVICGLLLCLPLVSLETMLRWSDKTTRHVLYVCTCGTCNKINLNFSLNLPYCTDTIMLLNCNVQTCESALALLPAPVSMQCPALQVEPAPTAGTYTGIDLVGLGPLLAAAVLASVWAMLNRSNDAPMPPRPACFIGKRRWRPKKRRKRPTSGPSSYRMRGAVLLFIFAGRSVYGMIAGETPLGSTKGWGGVCRRVLPAKMHRGAPEDYGGPWSTGRSCREARVASWLR